jgi:hypothetical protein
MRPSHFYYDAAARAVAEGLMDLTPEGRFEPWRAVTGAEAVLVVDALARLAAGSGWRNRRPSETKQW